MKAYVFDLSSCESLVASLCSAILRLDDLEIFRSKGQDHKIFLYPYLLDVKWSERAISLINIRPYICSCKYVVHDNWMTFTDFKVKSHKPVWTLKSACDQKIWINFSFVKHYNVLPNMCTFHPICVWKRTHWNHSTYVKIYTCLENQLKSWLYYM